MGITKTELFNSQQVKAAEFAKALAHPARIAILEVLANRNTCFCGDITEVLPLAQSTVSQHLKALKSSGIIKGEIDGVRTCYCLNEEAIEELRTVMDKLFSSLSTPNCC